MNETITTIVGNVVDEPNRRRLESGVSVTSFRVASTARRFDRATSHWTDGESLYLKVTCWRALAENVYRSFVKGDPVVITGRLFTRLYEVGESRRAAYELEATAAGFDLNRGVSTFKRVSNRGTTVDEVGVDGLPSGGAVDAHLEAAKGPSRSPSAWTPPQAANWHRTAFPVACGSPGMGTTPSGRTPGEPKTPEIPRTSRTPSTSGKRRAAPRKEPTCGPMSRGTRRAAWWRRSAEQRCRPRAGRQLAAVGAQPRRWPEPSVARMGPAGHSPPAGPPPGSY